MYDNGKQQRMKILEDALNSRISELLKTHFWKYSIEKQEDNGEYLLIKIEKNSTIKKFALLYSQSTDKKVYQQIESEADACLLHGMSFDVDNYFSKDFSKPLMLAHDLLNILKEWNQEAAQLDIIDLCVNTQKHKPIPIPEISYLVAENQSEQIWMMIKSLKSIEICKRFISRRYPNKDDDYITKKAEGVSFLMQNACEFFDNSQFQNFTQRLLNIYYGTLAFIEAELLVSSDKHETLHDVENITKNGHGLYTTWSSDNGNPNNLFIGVLGKDKGLFPCFLDCRSLDISKIPLQRVTKNPSPEKYCFTFNSLLNRIPELASLMRLIDDNYHAGFFNIAHDFISNQRGNMFSSSKGGYNSKVSGTYVNVYDHSKSSSLNDIKLLKGPLEQHEICKDSEESLVYKVFVKHEEEKNKYWHNHLNTHNSSFCNSSILVPLNGLGDDWETYSVMILYTLSIIVRYYPNLWRRIQYGEWDKYYPVFQQFAMVAEKILPHLFYEKITGQRLHVQQSGIF